MRIAGTLSVAAVMLAAAGCKGVTATTEKATKAPTATVSNGNVKESDLATITLAEEAERRLGIQVATAQEASGRGSKTWAGEIILPPGQSLIVNAPVSGSVAFPESGIPAIGSIVRRGQPMMRLSPFAPVQRDLRVTVEADVQAAQARVDAAKLRLDRAERLLREQVGSVRAREVAQEDLALAETALKAARARLQQIDRAPLDADVTVPVPSPQSGMLRQLNVASGQTVTAGSPLFEVARLDSVWVRVPVYVGEVSPLVKGAAASIRPLNAPETSPARQAVPVSAPPTSDPLASTVDLYFALPNGDGNFQPGQRISARLPMKTEDRGVRVPWSAVVYDFHGGAWVYENVGPQKFTRRRVELTRISDGFALVHRGIGAGAKIVIAGAAELFGTEFGPGK